MLFGLLHAPGLWAWALEPCVEAEVKEAYRDVEGRNWLGARGIATYRAGTLRLRLTVVVPSGPLGLAGAEAGHVLVVDRPVDAASGPRPAPAFLTELLPGLQVDSELRFQLEGSDQREFVVSPTSVRGAALAEIVGLRLLATHGWLSNADAIVAPATLVPEACMRAELRRRVPFSQQKGWLGLGEWSLLWSEDRRSRIHIDKLTPGGPLALAGALEADEIFAIDDLDLTRIERRLAGRAVRGVLAGLKPRQQLHMRLRRDEGLFEIDLVLPSLEGGRLASVLGGRLMEAAGILYSSLPSFRDKSQELPKSAGS